MTSRVRFTEFDQTHSEEHEAHFAKAWIATSCPVEEKETRIVYCTIKSLPSRLNSERIAAAVSKHVEVTSLRQQVAVLRAQIGKLISERQPDYKTQFHVAMAQLGSEMPTPTTDVSINLDDIGPLTGEFDEE